MLLKGLNLGHNKYEFSSLALSLSLEGKASHRELTSRLLSDLTGKVLSQGDMARAFDKTLHELADLILDTPEAPQVGVVRVEQVCAWFEVGEQPCVITDAGLLFLSTGLCSQMLGQFIARAIADHALPMAFLDRYKGKVDCDYAR